MRRVGEQRGNIALVMVIVLMTMGLLLLKTLHFYQDNARDEFFREKSYIEAFNQAESALAWGLKQSWRLTTYRGANWQCQRPPTQTWVSCIKHYKSGQFVLSGKGLYKGRHYVTVYRWVAPISKTQKVRPRIKGWLDYCPVNQKGFCS
ncbi:YgdB family protein [Providencia stuartii]|uniref:YgdB family protein n=1 Tax=Providencia stuartii TaxID=588 RepID=UPI002989B6C8|nr:YgdB family protein [Providencia stuartii]